MTTPYPNDGWFDQYYQSPPLTVRASRSVWRSTQPRKWYLQPRKWYLINNMVPEKNWQEGLGAPFSEGEGWGIPMGMNWGPTGNGEGQPDGYTSPYLPVVMTDRGVEGHLINMYVRSL